MSCTTQQPSQYSVSSGTTQHSTAKPRIRPNNQAPPHNALQHLAPTFSTPHYSISLHISPHHQTPSSISRNTLHRTTGSTKITYRPALSTMRTRRSTMLHHAKPPCAALHSTALLRTNMQYSAPPNIILHHSTSWRISLYSLFITESHHYFYIIKINTLATKRNRSQTSFVSRPLQLLTQLIFSLL